MALINLISIIRAPSSGWRHMCLHWASVAVQTGMLLHGIAAPWASVSERRGSFRQRCSSGGSAEGGPAPGLLPATALRPAGAPRHRSIVVCSISFFEGGQCQVQSSPNIYVYVRTCSDSWTCSWRFLVTTSSSVLLPSAPEAWGRVWSCFSTDSMSSWCNLVQGGGCQMIILF